MHGQLQLAASWPTDAVATDVPPAALDRSARPHRRGTAGSLCPARRAGVGVFRLQERDGHALLTRSRSGCSRASPPRPASCSGWSVCALNLLRDTLSWRRAPRSCGLADRLIAAQDEERRRLERDIHDGAQQHLVALAVNLRVIETVAAKDPARAADILHAQATAAREAIETLSQLSRGIYPRQLADAGLAAALRAGVAGTAIPVEVLDETTGRPPDDVEAALYFFAMEAIQNAAKHARASRITVRLESGGSETIATVIDDGVGFARRRARCRRVQSCRRGRPRQHARPDRRRRRDGDLRVGGRAWHPRGSDRAAPQ